MGFSKAFTVTMSITKLVYKHTQETCFVFNVLPFLVCICILYSNFPKIILDTDFFKPTLSEKHLKFPPLSLVAGPRSRPFGNTNVFA